ncbi:hypothetical protein [Cupriavidus necator]
MDWYIEYYVVDFDEEFFYLVDQATGKRLDERFLELEDAERARRNT